MCRLVNSLVRSTCFWFNWWVCAQLNFAWTSDEQQTTIIWTLFKISGNPMIPNWMLNARMEPLPLSLPLLLLLLVLLLLVSWLLLWLFSIYSIYHWSLVPWFRSIDSVLSIPLYWFSSIGCAVSLCRFRSIDSARSIPLYRIRSTDVLYWVRSIDPLYCHR